MLVFGRELVAVSNNFIPDAPVINFRLPMFGKEGCRNWFVSGNQGIYISEEEVDVRGMKICLFSGDERELLEAVIESPSASIFINQNRASGQDLIDVKGEGYHLSGKDWTWDGKLKKMCINKEVRVVFDQSLNGMLSYEKK